MVYLSSNSVYCVAFKPDNPNVVVSGSRDTTIKTWDITSGSCLSTLSGHSDDVYSVAWSPDGTKLASGSSDDTVRIWEAATGKQPWQLRGHRYAPSLSKECFLSFG